MTLEVRVTNEVAQSVYTENSDFKMVGFVNNYYSDNQEDGLVMWVNI